MIARRGLSTFTRVLLAPNTKATNGGAPKQPKAPKSEKAKSPEKSAVKAEAKPSAKVEAKPPQAEAYKTVSDKYESPEYYQHNRDSFADTMVTMAKYRLPQVTTSQAY